ncbi:MAG: glycoside hydrolase family 27 protein [Opitutae bacterium]|nr:glycoside hydrolase family 27 protein [Opitutae bacterium]
MKGAFLHSLGLCLLLASVRATDLSGTWKADLVRRGDVHQPLYLVLRQSGGRLEGRVFAPAGGELPLLNAHFEGGDAVFDTQFGMHYRLRSEGPSLHVTVRYEWRPTDETTAIRVADTEINPPAVVPLPALRLVPDNGLARTPPMGWNSWNRFGETIDDRTVREIADALVSSGMAAAGYTYVTIDDTWEGERDATGRIRPNGKFPDMKALGDYLHNRGLKFGIYSSPGTTTCAGYTGSYGHEEQDARTFADWGVDYLKYDWCSAGRTYRLEERRAACQRMGEALAGCGRPIVYSLSESSPGSDVWLWGPRTGANLWRTTTDIHDNWVEMEQIGFNQGNFTPYAGPGHWNDPDMLEVGNGGMTDTEYKTHFSLWCLLAAPLIAGNDLRQMSAATLSILTNRELIAVDQDPLGKQATRRLARDGLEVWCKPLQDGGMAIGLFNRTKETILSALTWPELGLLQPPVSLRDLWEHRDLKAAPDGYRSRIPAHGTIVLRVR